MKTFSRWVVLLFILLGYFQLVNCGSSVSTDDSTSDSATTESDYTTFNDATNWEAFDLQASDVSSNDMSGFLCGVFDGRYVYFCGNKNSSNVKYTTKKARHII
jgi:hypothetical protein